MKQQPERALRMMTSDSPDEGIERDMLAALRMRNASSGRLIDITQLHEDCRKIGYTPRELSKGFVCLIMRGFLKPCGSFSFILTSEELAASGRVPPLVSRSDDHRGPDTPDTLAAPEAPSESTHCPLIDHPLDTCLIKNPTSANIPRILHLCGNGHYAECDIYIKHHTRPETSP